MQNKPNRGSELKEIVQNNPNRAVSELKEIVQNKLNRAASERKEIMQSRPVGTKANRTLITSTGSQAVAMDKVLRND